ncbi:hypothetical protein [Pseudomonas sp. Irchel s3h17]|nr:hypothetical protein [Pseudomonas sp. Irchel s3h17]
MTDPKPKRTKRVKPDPELVSWPTVYCSITKSLKTSSAKTACSSS